VILASITKYCFLSPPGERVFFLCGDSNKLLMIWTKIVEVFLFERQKAGLCPLSGKISTQKRL
jgi:hypothetical protein